MTDEEWLLAECDSLLDTARAYADRVRHNVTLCAFQVDFLARDPKGGATLLALKEDWVKARDGNSVKSYMLASPYMPKDWLSTMTDEEWLKRFVARILADGVFGNATVDGASQHITVLCFRPPQSPSFEFHFQTHRIVARDSEFIGSMLRSGLPSDWLRSEEVSPTPSLSTEERLAAARQDGATCQCCREWFPYAVAPLICRQCRSVAYRPGCDYSWRH